MHAVFPVTWRAPLVREPNRYEKISTNGPEDPANHSNIALGSSEECELRGTECQVFVALFVVDGDEVLSVVQAVAQVLEGGVATDLVAVSHVITP